MKRGGWIRKFAGNGLFWWGVYLGSYGGFVESWIWKVIDPDPLRRCRHA